jgi:23S rRNA (adenine2503-C2)-methyltransferase
MTKTVVDSRLAELHPVARLPEEWLEWMRQHAEPAFRAEQVFRWIHQRGTTDPTLMTNLNQPLRSKLQEQGLSQPGQGVDVKRAADGTRKLLISFEGGAKVECVLIPMTPLNREETEHLLDPEAAEAEADTDTRTKVTLCISTQHGCAMGCVFCASGQFGLERALGAHEVVFQVLVAKEYLEPNETLSNLVFMGMGEPLHHYDTTRRALRLITHPGGIAMSPRRLTVSTVGLPHGIRKLGADFSGKVGLAVSLHAPDDETRSRIIPMNKRYPLKQLLQELKAYPLPRRRRITIEYTLIDGVNDSLEHAERLVSVLKGLRVKVNLIPMNPIEASELRAPQEAAVEHFRQRLAAAGYSCFVRTRRGDDVLAACGQLALKSDTVTLRRGKDRNV